MVFILCKICKQKVDFIHFQNHVKTSSHLANLPSRILITGTFKTTQLYAYFSQFGQIKQIVSVSNTNLEITYEDPNIHSLIIHHEHTSIGNNLKFSWYSNTGKFIHFSKQEELTNVATNHIVTLANLLKDSPTFSDQMTIFSNTLETFRDDFRRKCETVRGYLLSTCDTVTLYGSSTLNLDEFNSTCDFYVETNKRILSLLNSSGRFFDIAITTEGARCIYNYDGVKMVCCLNLNNKLYLKTSELIKYYLTIDEKIAQLMVLVKILVFCNIPDDRCTVSNYMLYLMVIFFLQQEPYKLPTVILLQDGATPHLIDGWNCSFQPKSCNTEAINNVTLLQLLQDFCNFYSDFDYFSCVISPFVGYTIPKLSFVKPYNLPECFSNYINSKNDLRMDSGLCIQDFFDHTNNVSKDLTYEFCGKLTAMCRSLVNLINLGETGLLYNLFIHGNDGSKIPIHQFDIIVENYENEKKCRDLVRDMIHKILSQVLYFSVKKTEDNTRIIYKCISKQNIWYERIYCQKKVVQGASFNTALDLEIATTSFVIKQYSLLQTGETNIELTFSKNPYRVTVHIAQNTVPQYHMEHFLLVLLKNHLVKKHKDKTEQLNNETKMKIETIKKAITGDYSLSCQLSLLLLKHLCPKEKILVDAPVILGEIKTILKPHYSQIKLQIFGSVILKLNDCFSALDFSMTLDKKISLTCLVEALKESDNFSNVSIGKKGQVEVIQCTHKKFNFVCNLWLKNEIWLCNTELVRFYFKKHMVLKELLQIVKFWIISCNLEEFFPTYVIYILLIFYFQQEKKLPSVKQLQEKIPPKIKEGWNCNFTNSDEKLQNLNLYNNLRDFFQFYSNFNYISYVISPYIGTAVPKIALTKPCNLKLFPQLDNKEEFFVSRGLCIQDFFEHSVNLTKKVPANIAGIFGNLCQKTYKALTSRIPQFKTFETQDNSNCFYIEMDKNNDEYLWRLSVKEHTLTILKKVMGCIVVKVENLSNSHIKYTVIELKRFWVGREKILKKLLKDLPKNCSDIDKDIAVTENITQTFPGNADWESQLELEFVKNPTRVEITFKGSDREALVAHFFYTRLVTLLGLKEGSKIETHEDLGNLPEWTCNYVKLYNPIVKSLQKGDSLYSHIAEEAKIRDSIQADLDSALDPIFTKPRIIGSSHIGVRFSQDIVDFYVENTRTHKETEIATMKLLQYLIGKSSDFCEVLIVKNKIPVIKFKHQKTGKICQLNVRYKISQRTSDLIRNYFNHANLKLLSAVIKFWSVLCKFKDEDGISSYVINLLIIFYLQQIYKVESVADLQKNLASDIVEGCNCAFKPPDLSEIKTDLNELICGFLKFYGNFDYISFIVSPYYGVSVEKTGFLEVPNFSLSCGLCVQDPFDHSNNVSCAVSLNSSGKFAALCRKSLEILQNAGVNVLLTSCLSLKSCGFSIEKNCDKSDRDWMQFIKINTSTILEDMLGCKVASLGNPEALCVIYNCVLNYDIWTHRLSVLKVLNEDLNKETAATTFIKDTYSATCLTKFVFDMSYDEKKKAVQVEVKGNGDIFHLTHFVYTRLREILEKENSEGSDMDISFEDSSEMNEDKQECEEPTDFDHCEEFKLGVIARLYETSTFDEQMATFLRNTRIEQDELENNRNLIQKDLTESLQMRLPSHKIQFFGSIVTNLGNITSIFDINIENIKPEMTTFELAKSCLMKSKRFSSVLITRKQFPVIECKHIETKAKCNLHILNKMWVCTSNLISYYLSLDQKLQDLMSLVNFWADCYGLKQNFFTSYTLYLMVIFYLQQEPYKLPRVKDLQKNITPEMVNGWNCAFNKLKYDSPALRNTSVLNLIIEFCRFYANFDYISFVITPFFGSAIGKTRFRFSDQNFPLNSGIAIQNLFDLSKNITSGISLECIGKFAALCRSSVEILTKNPQITQLLRINPEISFEIANYFPRDLDKWKLMVKGNVLKVLTIDLGCKLNHKNYIEANQFGFDCEVERNQIENVSKIFSPVETNKQRIVTSLEDLIEFSIEVTVSENICKILLIVKEENRNDLIFFITHVMYVKLLAYLSEKPVIFEGEDKSEEKSPEFVFENDHNVENTDFTESNEKIEDVEKCEQNEEICVVARDYLESPLSSESDKNDDFEEGEIVEEAEEDVPSDFFDDFSKEDFLDGLDKLDIDNIDDTTIKEEVLSKSSSRASSPKQDSNIENKPVIKQQHSRSISRSRSRSSSLSRKSHRRSRSSSSDSSRKSKKRSRSRSRSSSRRSEKYKKPKRNTFLEDIWDKLNKISTPTVQPVINNMLPNEFAMQVPVLPVPIPPVPQNSDPVYYINNRNVINQPQNVNFNLTGNTDFTQPTCVQTAGYQPVENIDQFFVEKKISISDFLAVTSQREVKASSQEELEKKTKIISRCQKAIRFLSEDLCFPDRFIVHPSKPKPPVDNIKHKSPLHRQPKVDFRYTSLVLSNEIDIFSETLDRVLQKLDLMTRNNNVDDLIDGITTALQHSSVISRETVAAILKASFLDLSSLHCDCKKNKSLANVGIQSRVENMSVSTQVNEKDLTSMRNMILNDSTAYFTLFGQRENGVRLEDFSSERGTSVLHNERRYFAQFFPNN